MHFVHLSSRVDRDRAARKHGAVATPQLVAIEFTVEDLTPCLYLFGTILGLETAPIARHPTLDADVAQIDAGGMVINLLCPTDTGGGTPLANPEPRLSQLNFVLQLTGELAELRSRCETAGAAVVERDGTSLLHRFAHDHRASGRRDHFGLLLRGDARGRTGRVSGDLPRVPSGSNRLLAEHRSVTPPPRCIAVQAPPAVSRLVTRLALRTLVAGVANIRPSVRGGRALRYFLRPAVPIGLRSSADPGSRGCVPACRQPLGNDPARLRATPFPPPETPYVLNALTEGRMDNPDETNPGMIRGVEFKGNLPVAPYPPPPRDRCRDLLHKAIGGPIPPPVLPQSVPHGCSTSSERSTPLPTATVGWLVCSTSC